MPTRTPPIARLRAQTFLAQQSGYSVLVAVIAQVTHIQHELAIAIDTAALQPGLLEQAQHALLVPGCRFGDVASRRRSRWDAPL